MYLTTLWIIWWGRNELIFRGKGFSAENVRFRAEVHKKSYHEAALKVGGELQRPLNSSAIWKPPVDSCMKLNVDASVRKGVGASIGGVLRNCEGDVRWCFAQTCEGVFDVDFAEALSIEKALELVLAHSVTRVVVESDSQTVINALREPGINLSYLGKILRNIEIKARDVEDITFCWARRSANLVAHKMAFFAYSCNVPYFSNHVPSHIVSDVDSDI
ncbi:hypothetical protein ACS0TY_010460 [Phlomoides rotata]